MCAPIKAAATGERVLELRVAPVSLLSAGRHCRFITPKPKECERPARGEMDSEIPFAALKKEKPVRGARAVRPGVPAAARDPARGGDVRANGMQGPLLRGRGGTRKFAQNGLKTLS